MGVLGVMYCDLFVYTAHGFHIERVAFNETLWSNLLVSLCQFWRTLVAVELLTGSIAADWT